MYTEEMAIAFHNIPTPPNFGVELYDSKEWITVLVDPKSLMNRSEEELAQIVDYINKVKLELESAGAYVLVARDALEE